MASRFITAQEMAEECGISISKAYEIIRDMNADLKAKGYLTIRGKVPRKYYLEKIYGQATE